MFEDEVELERESKIFSLKNPFLYIFLVVVLIIGLAGYLLLFTQRDLSTQQAQAVLSQAMTQRGPAYVHFRVGVVEPSFKEKPHDPHYKLLENAGFVKLAKAKNNAVSVKLTPIGEETFSKLPEFKKVANKDGTESLDVPLATREVVAVTKVTMVAPHIAEVDYTWKWNTNKVGDVFDASSASLSKFSVWDRQNLINNYGAAFYHETQKSTVRMIRGDEGWRIATD
jgi:hypothetical protein